MEYRKNDILTVTIEDMGNEGEGIGRTDGYTLFVKDAVIGDIVSCKIMKAKKNYAYARLLEVLTPSPFRVTPACPLYRQCGGCQLQALQYEKQLEFKQNRIRNSLVRIGGFSEALIDECLEPIVGMENPYRYRNKAQFPIGEDKDGNPVAGFYAARTHAIIPNTDCLLGTVENKAILETVLAYMKKNKVRAYNEATGKGTVRHVLIRKGFASGQIMVCLVVNIPEKEAGKNCGTDGRLRLAKEGETGCVRVYETDCRAYSRKGHETDSHIDSETGCCANHGKEWERDYETGCKRNQEIEMLLPTQDELIHALSKIHGMTGVSVNINRERTNVILGKEIYTIWGNDTIRDTIHVRNVSDFSMRPEEIHFNISPLSFYQVNPGQTEKLYSLALTYAGLTGKETVWDLYCGIGTISLFLAGKAKQVYGVEIIPQAVEDARKNAALNEIGNVEFFIGKVEEVLPEKYEKEGIHADVIVVDPPRKGCDSACLETMLKMQPKRIVYISCDPATLARDLRVLCEGGYGIEKGRGVDLFGESVHVETAVLLVRKP